jgi:quercetin dioxygenase-like cupin family protein
MDHFCDRENRETKELIPGIRIRSFWGKEMLVAIIDLEPDVLLPMHSHPYEQAGTVVCGQLELTIGRETRTLGPEETYIIPAGMEHGGRAAGVPTRVWDVFSPVREDYKY